MSFYIKCWKHQTLNYQKKKHKDNSQVFIKVNSNEYKLYWMCTKQNNINLCYLHHQILSATEMIMRLFYVHLFWLLPFFHQAQQQHPELSSLFKLFTPTFKCSTSEHWQSQFLFYWNLDWNLVLTNCTWQQQINLRIRLSACRLLGKTIRPGSGGVSQQCVKPNSAEQVSRAHYGTWWTGTHSTCF